MRRFNLLREPKSLSLEFISSGTTPKMDRLVETTPFGD